MDPCSPTHMKLGPVLIKDLCTCAQEPVTSGAAPEIGAGLPAVNTGTQVGHCISHEGWKSVQAMTSLNQRRASHCHCLYQPEWVFSDKLSQACMQSHTILKPVDQIAADDAADGRCYNSFIATYAGRETTTQQQPWACGRQPSSTCRLSSRCLPFCSGSSGGRRQHPLSLSALQPRTLQQHRHGPPRDFAIF